MAHVAGPAREQHRITVERRLVRWQGQAAQAFEAFANRSRTDDGLAGRQHGAGLQRVLQPQLDWVQTERGRQLVHLRLIGEARLHRAEAAHRAAWGIVGEDRRPGQSGVGNLVRPGGERRGVADYGRRGRCVGAAVDEQSSLDTDERPVAPRAVAHPHARRVPMHVTIEGFLPAITHLDWSPSAEGEQAGVDLHADVLPSPESPTHARKVKPHLFRRQPQAGRELFMIGVEPLGRNE